jgi:hypothetical protein
MRVDVRGQFVVEAVANIQGEDTQECAVCLVEEGKRPSALSTASPHSLTYSAPSQENSSEPNREVMAQTISVFIDGPAVANLSI